MSIYSGFPTRRDEQKYNHLLSQLICTLQNHLLSLLPQEISQKHLKTYSKILSKMKDYEQHKYLPPKFSELMTPLARAIGIEIAEEKKVEIDEMAEEREKVKASARSLHKPKFNIGLEHFTEMSKKVDMGHGMALGRDSPHGTLPKKQLFQSCSSKLARPKPIKGIFPVDHQVQLSEQYHQQKEDGDQLPGLIRGRVNSNGGSGGKARYRAFQALHEVQSNLHKRNVPLRQEMRRKLKTQG